MKSDGKPPSAMKRIEAHIKSNGPVTSISKMANDLGISYSWVWTCLLRLEFDNRIRVHRNGAGSPATMTHASHTPTDKSDAQRPTV